MMWKSPLTTVAFAIATSTSSTTTVARSIRIDSRFAFSTSAKKKNDAREFGATYVIHSMAVRHHIVAKTEVVPLHQVNDAINRVRHNKARYRMVLKMA